MTENLSHAISLATYFRENGIRTQLYSEKRKFKAKIGYADKLRIPYVAFLGEDEIAGNTVALKNLESGEQQALSKENAAKLVLDTVIKMKQATLIG